MRVIKPGKLGVVTSRSKKSEDIGSAPSKVREVWDDFAPTKKTKKKSYEKGSGDRMIPTGLNAKPEAEAAPEPIEEESSYKPRTDFDTLQTALSYEFKDAELLQHALTHRSALGVSERADYERLEFLGDAVLDLSIAHLLSDQHPEAREGDLSKMRAALVNTQALAEIARTLEVGPFIRLGRGEQSSGGADRPSILADVMEAIIGAIYRDSGYEVAFNTIEGIYGDQVSKVTPFDPKTELQEVLHAAGSEPPEYLLELVEGPEHAPTFVTVVKVDNEIVGRGRGATKKAAQQLAASETLSKLISPLDMPKLADGQQAIIASALMAANNFRTTTP